MRYLLPLLVCFSAACDSGHAEFDVTPVAETDPVPSSGDAADDIAIWVHPTDKTKSVIVGANKAGGSGGGLFVYGFDGKLISSVTGKRMNNVDGRYGFTLGGKTVDLFASTNRTDESADLFAIDPDTRKLTQIGSVPLGKTSGLAGFHDPYGIALGQDRASGTFHLFVSDRLEQVVQFELSESGGKVVGKRVRHWKEAGTVEGIVCDDAAGCVFIGVERSEVLRYAMTPKETNATGKPGKPPADRRVVDSTKGRLTADIEGLAIYPTTGDGGYLLVSSQGNNRFVIYDRKTLNYLATFRVRENARRNIGGVNDTDGIDAVSGNLGPLFPLGAFIAQDGHNGENRQNFKIVSWKDVIDNAAGAKVQLTGDGEFDPRKR